MNSESIKLEKSGVLVWINMPAIDRWKDDKRPIFEENLRNKCARARLHIHNSFKHKFPSPFSIGAMVVPASQFKGFLEEIAKIIDPVLKEAEEYLKNNTSIILSESMTIEGYIAKLHEPVVTYLEVA